MVNFCNEDHTMEILEHHKMKIYKKIFYEIKVILKNTQVYFCNLGKIYAEREREIPNEGSTGTVGVEGWMGW